MFNTILMNRKVHELTAQLMSVENITVKFDSSINAPATFNIKTRTLSIKPLIDEHIHLTPGLIAHEVGHVLFTNPDKDARADIELNGISNVMQVLEDGYQERKMCLKFPGSKKHLMTLFDHFFIKDEVVVESKMITIVNTLNYNAKGSKYGKFLAYPDYVSHGDLIALYNGENITDEIYANRKLVSDDIIKLLKKYAEDDESSDESPDESSDDGVDTVVDDIITGSDDFNDHHDKIKTLETSNVPTIVTPEQLESSSLIYDGFEVDDIIKSSDNKLYVSQSRLAKLAAQTMYSNFTSRLSTRNYAKTGYVKSGSLDPTRLTLHKLTDDIFVNTEICPAQPNHAYVVMLDWSGSMEQTLMNLTHRIMELVYFCEIVGIDIEIIAFTTHDNMSTILDDNIACARCKFINVLNTSEQSSTEVLRRLKSLWNIVYNLSTHQYVDDAYKLYGTNITEAMILGHHRLSKLHAEHKTLFLLTDGNDTRDFQVSKNHVLQTARTSGIIFNGIVVENNNLKNECTRLVRKMYDDIGHNTTGISWNNTSPVNAIMFGNEIKINIEFKKDHVEFNKMSNVFINEIVQQLL